MEEEDQDIEKPAAKASHNYIFPWKRSLKDRIFAFLLTDAFRTGTSKDVHSMLTPVTALDWKQIGGYFGYVLFLVVFRSMQEEEGELVTTLLGIGMPITACCLCRPTACSGAIWCQLVSSGAAHAVQSRLPRSHPVSCVQPAHLAEQ